MKRIDPKLFEPYGQILFFLQKGQDLDTSAAAFALLTLVKNKFPHKEIGIVGMTVSNKILPEINAFKVSDVNKLNKEVDTLGIFCDIVNSKQVGCSRFVTLCKHICVFDHHEQEETDEWDQRTTKRLLWDHRDPSYSSCCELLWDLIDWDKFEMTKDVASYLCWGLASDNRGLTSPTTNKRTFEILAEMADLGVDASSVIRDYNRLNFLQIQMFCSVIQNHSAQKGKVLFMNLPTKVVMQYMPYCFNSLPGGRIAQGKCFTYILNKAQQLIKADVLILTHYSLITPYDENKKLVYVVLNKPSAILEEILRRNEFVQQRDRWTCTKGMSLQEVHNLIFVKFGNEFGVNNKQTYNISNK